VRRRERQVGEHVLLAVVHELAELGPAGAELVGDVAPGLPGAVLIGLQEGLAQRRGDDRLLPLACVSQGVPHPMHDPNAIDAVRFVVFLPFAGAGLVQRRRRRDARFP
jgi:hypothetical protein